jgi:hypothetical protein
VHSGFGAGEAWNRLFENINGGWNEELENLRRYLIEGIAKTRRG